MANWKYNIALLVKSFSWPKISVNKAHMATPILQLSSPQMKEKKITTAGQNGNPGYLAFYYITANWRSI